MTKLPRLLTTDEAAAHLRRSPQTLRNWRTDTRRTGRQKGPKWVDINGTPMYMEEEIARYQQRSPSDPFIAHWVREMENG